MSQPFFSIVMPAYNVERFVTSGIESILSQTFKDWELVIVDDASSDSTLQKIAAFNDSRIRSHSFSQNSGGVFLPRKKAEEIAEGKFIVPIDADDIVEPVFLEKLHSVITETSADLIIPEMWRFYEGIEPYKILPDGEVDSHKVYNGKSLVALTIPYWKIPMAGFAVKKEIYRSANEMALQYCSKIELCDEVLSRLLLYLSPSVMFSDARYLYRINAESVTHNIAGEIERRLAVADGLIAMIRPLYGVSSSEYRHACKTMFNCLVEGMRQLNSHEINATRRKELTSLLKVYKMKIDISHLHGDVGFHYLFPLKMPFRLSAFIYRLMQILNSKFQSRNINRSEK